MQALRPKPGAGRVFQILSDLPDNVECEEMSADNVEIADLLDRVADLLEVQRAEPFRVRAYRRGAQTCRTHAVPLFEILRDEGEKGLDRLPYIGRSLARSIAEYLHTGRLRLLDRLEGQVSPEDLFTTLPGIGEELARQIHEELGVETLEELELAAHDGRLATVKGFGQRRVQAVRDELAAVLSRSVRRRARRVRLAERGRTLEAPPAAAILAVDAEYRRRAAEDTLRRIAPRRFNPEGRAWLPVLHTTREGWFFTALFSNTARAHRLKTTRDWVVIVYERNGDEGQCTVVTEPKGPLAGRRVIRGREAETPPLDAVPVAR